MFTPHKKANKFNYIPQFYDPVKEAREQRRRELRGESVETDNAAEYTPGMYLRTQRDARAERRRNVSAGGSKSSGIVVAAMVVLLLLFVYMLYPRIIGLLSMSGNKRTVTVTEEFDPYAPILVVPNDYQEE